jgi:hypothetical protein
MKRLHSLAASLLSWGLASLAILGTSSASVYAQDIVFVSVAGSNQNNGSIKFPFKSIDKAVSVKKQGTPLIIYLRAGEYILDKSLAISSADISLIGYNKEIVTITASRKIDLFTRELVTDAKSYPTLPSSSVGHVYAVNLKNYGIIDYGQMGSSGSTSRLQPSGINIYSEDDKAVYQLARWPKADQKLLGISAVADIKVPRPSFGFGCPPDLMNDYTQFVKSNLDSAADCWVDGQFSVGWLSDNVKIFSLDQKARTITLFRLPNRGLYTNNDPDGKIRSANNVRGFYFYNNLAFLTRPGEWYFDRKTGILFVWPASANKSPIQIELGANPLIAIGNSKGIRIENIKFSGSRGDLLSINRSNDIVIDGCQFRNAGLRGINCLQSTSVKVQNSYFAGIGAGGIHIDGGDKSTLAPGNNVVTGCEFTNYSVRYKSYSPAIDLDGVGNHIENNYIHDAADQAILFTGNSQVIRSNRIENVCQYYNDMGAVYTYRSLRATGSIVTNNHFKNINNKYSSMIAALYVDGGTSGIAIDSNTFVNCGTPTGMGYGAIMVGGGAFNRLRGNRFINCNIAYSESPFTIQQLKGQFMQQFGLIPSGTRSAGDKEQKASPDDEVLFKTYSHLNNLRNLDDNTYKNFITGSQFQGVKVQYYNVKDRSLKTNFTAN